jgi:hypothetical protein
MAAAPAIPTASTTANVSSQFFTLRERHFVQGQSLWKCGRPVWNTPVKCPFY